ncbi:unnamed protein product [Schistosoma margrebowiei]|uniref:Trematode Eggshell Synthesis domain containing protein n=1 Tax=Schistosoma margrebowiei TaxID=48269 RepID=A0AA85A6R4_9TREM|nr:unnamed protein product [Schistosoma margrebowiei]
MEIKMKLLFLIYLIHVTTAQEGRTRREEITVDNQRKASESRSERNTKETGSEFDRRHSGQTGLETAAMTGTSRSQYKHRKQGQVKAVGKFRSRGMGRYGLVSSESTYYVIEGKFDRYGRKRPTKSNFKTRGKEKKYSKKIVDNQFDIKGGLIEERKYKQTGDYQANGTHVYIDLQSDRQKSVSSKTKIEENKSKEEKKDDKTSSNRTTINSFDLLK